MDPQNGLSISIQSSEECDVLSESFINGLRKVLEAGLSGDQAVGLVELFVGTHAMILHDATGHLCLEDLMDRLKELVGVVSIEVAFGKARALKDDVEARNTGDLSLHKRGGRPRNQ